MDELKVIWRKFPSYLCRHIIAVGAVLLQFLNEYKDKGLSDISTLTWVVIFVSCCIAHANTTSAWLSTAAASGRQEIAADKKEEAKLEERVAEPPKS